MRTFLIRTLLDLSIELLRLPMWIVSGISKALIQVRTILLEEKKKL